MDTGPRSRDRPYCRFGLNRVSGPHVLVIRDHEFYDGHWTLRSQSLAVAPGSRRCRLARVSLNVLYRSLSVGEPLSRRHRTTSPGGCPSRSRCLRDRCRPEPPLRFGPRDRFSPAPRGWPLLATPGQVSGDALRPFGLRLTDVPATWSVLPVAGATVVKTLCADQTAGWQTSSCAAGPAHERSQVTVIVTYFVFCRQGPTFV